MRQPEPHPSPAPHAPIDWRIPAPRGALDRFVGPGATRAELAIQFVPTGAITLGWLLHAHATGAAWSPLQTIVAALIALDMVGGVITNATGAAKRWYHRPGQRARHHLGFVALHAVQPLVVVALFAPHDYAFAWGSFGLALAGALAVLAAPPYLQRPVAGAALAAGLFVGLTLLSAPPHFEWFLPVYLIKLVWSHLVREEPYRAMARTDRPT